MFEDGVHGIFFIDRQRLQYASHPDSVLTLELPQPICGDLEILNKEAFETKLIEFIRDNKIGGGLVIVVISQDMSFATEIAEEEVGKVGQKESAFLDTIPFATVLSKLYPGDKKHTVVAVNGEYMSLLSSVLGRVGLQILGILPISILVPVSAKRWLDAEVFNYVMKNWNTLHTQTIMLHRVEGVAELTATTSLVTKKQRPYFLLFIFVILIGVLIYMLIRR